MKFNYTYDEEEKEAEQKMDDNGDKERGIQYTLFTVNGYCGDLIL